MPNSGARQLESGVPGLAVWLFEAVRWSGPTPLVETTLLRRIVTGLPPDVGLIGFVVDAGAAPRCSTLASSLDGGEWVGSAVARSVTEAVKRVDGDTVVAPVDRASLAIVTGPEVVLRSALESVLDIDPRDGWVSVTDLVARIGPVLAITV